MNPEELAKHRFAETKIYREDRETREGIREDLQRVFAEQPQDSFPPELREELKQREVPHTPELSKYIADANSALKLYLDSVGFEYHYIPEQNIHILPDDLYEKIMEDLFPGKESSPYIAASQEQYEQAIYAKQSTIEGGTNVFHIILHEMVHMSSRTTYDVKTYNGKPYYVPARFGVSFSEVGRGDTAIQETHARDPKHWFDYLNEVMTEEITIRAHATFAVENRAYIADDRVALEVLLNLNTGRALHVLLEDFYEKWQQNYGVNRELFEYILHGLRIKYPDVFPNDEAVFQQLLKSYYGSDIFNLIKYLKGAFGERGFEYIRSADLGHE